MGQGPMPKKKGPPCFHGGPQKKAAAYSPTWCSSTIGADGLNFPVRNGKGWAPSPWPPKIVGRDGSRQRISYRHNNGTGHACMLVETGNGTGTGTEPLKKRIFGAPPPPKGRGARTAQAY